MASYSQDFESYAIADTSLLLGDGWLVFGNVYDSAGVWQYGYGPFPAPNDGAAFCAVDSGQGGVDQGQQQLSVYSDYNNLDHGNANRVIESNVFQEQTIDSTDVGKSYIFIFDAKRGNIGGNSTASAFIKTIDPNNNFFLSNFLFTDMTNTATTWQGYNGISIFIDAGLVGHLLQFGFLNIAQNFEGSGIFYDNVIFREADPATATPVAPLAFSLHQNVPNPFNPATRIDFDLKQQGTVDLSVYDVTGRRVVTLFRGGLDAGGHHVTWDGRDANGAPSAAGIYRYVLRTDAGATSRSMVLIK